MEDSVDFEKKLIIRTRHISMCDGDIETWGERKQKVISVRTFKDCWYSLDKIPLTIKGSEYYLWGVIVKNERYAIYQTKDGRKSLMLDLVRHVNYNGGDCMHWQYFVYNMKNIKKDKKAMIKLAKEYFRKL